MKVPNLSRHANVPQAKSQPAAEQVRGDPLWSLYIPMNSEASTRQCRDQLQSGRDSACNKVGKNTARTLLARVTSRRRTPPKHAGPARNTRMTIIATLDIFQSLADRA